MAKRCSVRVPLAGRLILAVLLLHFGYSSRAAVATDFLIDSWRFDDDLPRDGINSITQGKDGYLWVSSRYGLARFDGARFTDYSSKVGAQFLGYHYANLTTDEAGTVWIATPGGGLLQWREQHLQLCLTAGNPVFGPAVPGLTNTQGKSVVITPDGRVLGWSNGVAGLLVNAGRWGEPVPASICQDKEGSIWFVTYQHKLIRVEGTNAQEVVWGSGDERRNWIALQTDAAGQLWAGTQRDVGGWQGKEFHPIPPPVEPFPVDDVIAIPEAAPQDRSEGKMPHRELRTGARFWVIALGRAWLLDGRRWIANVLFEPSTGDYETNPRVADQEGSLWFTGAKTGIARAGTDGSLMMLTEKDGLPPGRLAALYQDHEGSIWAGIEHAGLVRLRERFFAPVGLRDGTKAPLVWAVAEDSAGALWLATEHSGLHRWQESKFTQFNLGSGNLPGSVYSLCVDRQGAVWAGTGDKGVFRFENGKFVPVWEQPEPGWNKRVYVIYEDRLGQMWFGTGLGLFCWHSGSLRQVAGKGFDMGVVRAMTEDAGGRLWVAMSQGGGQRLACLEGNELVPRGAEAGLSNHDVFGLHADAGGSLWIGTVGDGLWRWQKGVFSHYTTEEGLPDDRIYSIAEDGRGNLWLGSPAGIMRLSKDAVAAVDHGQAARLECLLYNRTDGLPTRECSGGAQPSTFNARDGRLLFAMTEGAVALSPEAVKINAVPPPVLIEEVRVDGRPLNSNSRTQAPKALAGRFRGYRGGDSGISPPPTAFLEIPPGKHLVEFQYTATSLLAPSKVRFKCRLEGVDKDWREPSAARSEIYSLAAPGDYRFGVAACNNDGVWNEAGTFLTLRVAPFIWQTWWFRSGAGVLLLLALAGSIRFIERKKARRQIEHLERQQLVEKERARIARDIHDELGASLTEIGLLSEFARREAGPPEQVKADLEKIAGKAQSSTRALDQIVWAVNPRNDTVESFVTYACAYAQEQLGLADIRCRLDVASLLPRQPLRADLRHHLFMAFKEALNNILKHARASQVDIRFRADAGQLSVLISDNGCGFVYAGPGTASLTSTGLTGMKERLASVGAEIECDTAPARGTRIKLTMKLT